MCDPKNNMFVKLIDNMRVSCSTNTWFLELKQSRSVTKIGLRLWSSFKSERHLKQNFRSQGAAPESKFDVILCSSQIWICSGFFFFFFLGGGGLMVVVVVMVVLVLMMMVHLYMYLYYGEHCVQVWIKSTQHSRRNNNFHRQTTDNSPWQKLNWPSDGWAKN